MAGVIGLIVLVGSLGQQGRRFVRWGPVALGAGVTLAAVVFAWNIGTVDRLTATGADIRMLAYPGVIEGALDRVLLGQGARGFISGEAAQAEWQYAHNSYLESAFEFGLPAAVFFIALGLIGLRLLSGVMNRPGLNAVGAFALATFSAAGVHAAFDGSLQIPAIAALFAAVLGIGWRKVFPSNGALPRPRRPSFLREFAVRGCHRAVPLACAPRRTWRGPSPCTKRVTWNRCARFTPSCPEGSDGG